MNPERALAIAHAVARARGTPLDVWTFSDRPEHRVADYLADVTPEEVAAVNVKQAMDRFRDDRVDKFFDGSLRPGLDELIDLWVGTMQSLGSVVVKNAAKRHARDRPERGNNN